MEFKFFGWINFVLKIKVLFGSNILGGYFLGGFSKKNYGFNICLGENIVVKISIYMRVDYLSGCVYKIYLVMRNFQQHHLN